MSRKNEIVFAVRKTIKSLRKLSVKKRKIYIDSNDRYYLGKAQAYDIAADILEIDIAALSENEDDNEDDEVRT